YAYRPPQVLDRVLQRLDLGPEVLVGRDYERVVIDLRLDPVDRLALGGNDRVDGFLEIDARTEALERHAAGLVDRQRVGIASVSHDLPSRSPDRRPCTNHASWSMRERYNS